MRVRYWSKPSISVRSVLDLDKTWWQQHRPSTRRLVQLYSALLYNAHLRGFIDGEIYQGTLKTACVPGFNCYSCPGAIGACPLGSIQNALVASGHRAGWYVIGIILLFGITLGRTICGWFCPLGLIQELLHKIPTPKLRKSRFTRVLSTLKYIILVVFVFAIPIWYEIKHDLPLPSFCKYICPAGTLEGAMGLLSNPVNAGKFSMLGILFTRKFVIMIVIGLACIFCYRSFCRFLCPLGAIYGLFNRFCLIGVHVDRSRCNHCGACVRSCGMDVRHVGDHECISCGKCMDACHQNAISIRAGSIILKAPEIGCTDKSAGTKAKRRGRILWVIALVVLCFALLWYNWLDPSVRKKAASQAGSAAKTVTETEPAPEPSAQPDTAQQAATYESSAPVGYEVGEQLEDFTAECLDGSTFHLADTRGKVTIINLWATHCTPCKLELPYFNELYKAHQDDIAMLIVHSSLVVDDVDEYLSDKHYEMPFTIDSEDDEIWDLVGGSSTMPQTIVLNRHGEVIYNQTKSVTPEILEALYQQAAADIETPVSAGIPASETRQYSSDAPIGYEVGEQLADFSAECMDGSTFHLADTRGKVTVINLWATHCAPCKQELPYFNDLYKAHRDDIAMLIVHS
ncbi:MAG: redoxin domain-containing protein, partial [Clostridia bacterium]|nr:redoxin domain-containing protein [Clostridia bacterium]